MKRILFAPLLIILSFAPWWSAAQASDSTGAHSRTVTLAVENMTCGVCPVTVRKALQRVPGVTKASADMDSHSATVTFDPSKTTVEALTQATTDAGYPSHVKKR